MFVGLVLLFVASTSAQVLAGVAKVDCSLPIGAPLAGINHGARRVKDFPIPHPTPYTTWMTPSTGLKADGIWCRALTLQVDGELVSFAAIDAIGADGTMRRNAVKFAHGLGFTVPMDSVILSGSHSHSGPAAITSEFLWSIAPATDLEVPLLTEIITNGLAQALAQSQSSMRPAKVDAGSFNLTGVTKNRRCHRSHFVNCTTIDPHLGVLRVDDADGTMMAVLWNFAMHGTCFGPENLEMTGDIMGWTNRYIEASSSAISLFQNADAGDVDPDYDLCRGDPQTWTGPPIIGKAVLAAAESLSPSAEAKLSSATKSVDFGPVIFNATLASTRFDNCSSGGPIDVCTLCRVLDCKLDGKLQSGWIETTPQFTAVRLDVGGKRCVFVTCPGEAIVELGWQVRNDTQKLGYSDTFFVGYSQNHMGYFTTPNEYEIGGYEAQLTLWGITTSARIRDGMYSVASLLASSS